MKIGYKGFDENLKCLKDQFSLEGAFTKISNRTEPPRVCTADGYHYCNKLEDVFSYYSDNGDNRFCEIEVLGPFTDLGDKSVTTSFRIIREIPSEEIFEQKAEECMHLRLLRNLQTKFPLLHVGGSIGLFLHGIRLKRWKGFQATDMDLIHPYFVVMDSENVQEIAGKKSSNDFDNTYLVDGVKADVKIDPYQKYELVKYKEFTYKVSKFETIMAAKMRYAVLGQQKHKDDIREMCGFKEQPKPEWKDKGVNNGIPF